MGFRKSKWFGAKNKLSACHELRGGVQQEDVRYDPQIRIPPPTDPPSPSSTLQQTPYLCGESASYYGGHPSSSPFISQQNPTGSPTPTTYYPWQPGPANNSPFNHQPILQVVAMPPEQQTGANVPTENTHQLSQYAPSAVDHTNQFSTGFPEQGNGYDPRYETGTTVWQPQQYHTAQAPHPYPPGGPNYQPSRSATDNWHAPRPIQEVMPRAQTDLGCESYQMAIAEWHQYVHAGLKLPTLITDSAVL